MKTRHLFILLLALFATLSAKAQNNIAVASFRLLDTDLTANLQGTSRIDQNGHTCALIKVVTTQTGFSFDVGIMGITDTEQKAGEIWVWVPFGVKHISIGHPTLGFLRDYYFPCSVEEARTYEMVLTTGTVETIVKETITQQWLVFNVTPKDALVWVNEEPWLVTEGVAQKYVDFGTYVYRVEASNYHSSAGKILVNDPDNTVKQDINLEPAFGFLKIEGDNGILSKASIYIDKDNGADALRTPRQLSSGQHTVRIVHPKYKTYERKVNIEGGQTFTLNANLAANFSTITLKVDANAEIWVNNEKKGTRTWTGDLEAGNYTVECRMKNHRPSMAKHTITDNMSGLTITLDKPTPITGRLMVSSTPSLAKLFIDGEQVGETPKTISQIIIGEHTVRIEKAGCAPVSKTVTIEEGRTCSLEEKLNSGRSLTIETDRAGDKVYVDNEFVGETPLHTSIGFGSHTVKAVRGKNEQSKDIEVTTNGKDVQLFFEFGRMITITTDHDGDAVFVDGERVGISPVRVDLTFGRHTIHAQRDKKFADKDIVVSKTGSDTEHHLVLHGETAKSFVARGVNFATLNFAYSPAPQTSFGFAVGSVKKVGWFVTAMSNFGFKANGFDYECDADGLVDGSYPDYDGGSCTTRLSVMGGAVFRLGGPVCLRLGAGYGTRVRSLSTHSGSLVNDGAASASGIDATAGLQLNLKGFTMSLDAVSTSFKTLELKLGIGYCWKKK